MNTVPDAGTRVTYPGTNLIFTSTGEIETISGLELVVVHDDDGNEYRLRIDLCEPADAS